MDILTNISLFTGAGGLDLGARLVGGFRTIAYVERDRYAQGVIMSRIRDGGLDAAPIWDDVCTFDGRPWRGLVDVVSGGFPCQDVSLAGKREGMSGARSGLWREFARIVREVGPRFVLVENVPGLISCGGIGDVLGDLAAGGYDARWAVRSASDVGALHIRARVWIVAHAQSVGCGSGGGTEEYLEARWKKHGTANLNAAVKFWPTPRGSDGVKGGPNQRGSKGDMMLPAAVHHFPTPTAGDARSSGSRNLEGSKAHAGVSLTDAIVRGGSTKRGPAAGGQLNPSWVEWLMGWPTEWTVLDSAATAWFRSSRPRRGRASGISRKKAS